MQKIIPFIASLCMVAAGAAFAANPASAATPTATPKVVPAKASLEQTLVRLQRLADEESLRNLAYSYGRGNDAIAIRHGDRAAARKDGQTEYARSMADDVRIEVYALGNKAPLNSTTGIPAWVDFVDQYFATQRYTSTVHLMSNFHIEFINRDQAVIGAYAVVPHFIRHEGKDKAGADASVEFMNCRYRFEARRQKDGSWKTVRLTIELQDIWRGIGFFPAGQGPGL